MSFLSRMVDWLRAGYPAGVPEQDYVPLLAVLGRRLTQEEIEDVSHELRTQGLIPAGRVDVGVGISRITDELPTHEEIERVMHRLEAIGYPVLDDDFERLTNNVQELPGGYVIARVRPAKLLDPAQVAQLYSAVGAASRVLDAETVGKAIRRSHRVVAAWDGEGHLVGLARSISDKVTVCFIQDVLVHPAHRHHGIGRAMITRLLLDYEDIPQIVVMTGDDDRLGTWYEDQGFTRVTETAPRLRSYVRRGFHPGIE